MSKRFKNMEEVDDYLEKHIQFDDSYRCIIDIIQEKNTCLVNFINSLIEENKQLIEENRNLKKYQSRISTILENGGALLTEKQLIDVIGEDKTYMFFREQETSNKLQEIKADAKVALLIIKAIWPLPFKISINEAASLKRLSENVGELLNTEGD